MVGITAVFDSCVLFPAALRDLLVRLARTELFRAHWSNDIHDEWIRSVLDMRPDLSRERLQRTRDLMNEHVLDSLVTDYVKHIPTIILPDADDRHVVAAAIEAQAALIVTFNLKDFPQSALQPLNLTAIHPDDFLLGLLDTDEPVVRATIRSQRLDLKYPPMSAAELLATLEMQGLPRTVKRLQAKISSL